jgi:hypothetical protein
VGIYLAGVDGDCTGRLHGGPIELDKPVATNEWKDAGLVAAAVWLERQAEGGRSQNTDARIAHL